MAEHVPPKLFRQIMIELECARDYWKHAKMLASGCGANQIDAFRVESSRRALCALIGIAEAADIPCAAYKEGLT